MKPGRREAALILLGATGTGKTDLALILARRYIPAEIVSADSRLVYRHMNIGTAKPSSEMMARTPHHMIDLVDPDVPYTCKEFQTEARSVVHGILRRGAVPIVVGGSGLYVQALVDGVFDGPAANDEIRQQLTALAEEGGPERLWRQLSEVDPEKAAGMKPENLVRIIRALEVFEITGERMSDLEKTAKPLDVPYIKIGLRRDTADLYRIIDKRVDDMMAAGLLDETRGLIERGFGDTRAVRNTLGYRELIDHLRGMTSLDEAVALIKRNTRRFAKRQATWFRRDRAIHWVDIPPGAASSSVAPAAFEAYARPAPAPLKKLKNRGQA